MATKSKKCILISAELINSAIGAFYKELDFELHTDYNPDVFYEFIINDYLPELNQFPRIQIASEMKEECLAQVRGVIDEVVYSNVTGKKLLQSYFNDGQELDIVDRYSREFKNVYTYKIHEYLNIGYFIDSVVIDAYKAQFDIDKLRAYLNILMKFAFRRLEQNQNHYPIDLSYSHDGSAFAVQISFSVESFKGKREIEELRKDCHPFCNFFDVTYFGKKNRVSISSVSYKDAVMSSTQIYFYSEILSKLLKGDKKSEHYSALAAREEAKYIATKGEDLQNKKLMLARKFVDYINTYRKTEENPKELASLEVTDVIEYLSKYPKKDKLAGVDEEVQNFILKLLKESHLNQGITEYVEKVAKSNLDNQVESIQKVLGEKSLEDIEEIFSVKSGGTEDEGSTKVKGWLEDPNDDKTIVKGGEALSKEEKWELKKQEINKKIEEEVIKINSEGRNVVESDIMRVMAKALGAQEEDVKFVVKGVVEEAVTSELVKGQALEEAPALKLLSEKEPDQVREKLETQILKMKKLIDQMKKEIVRMQNEKGDGKVDGGPQLISKQAEGEINQLKIGLGKTLDALKGKEKMMEKQRLDFESHLKSRDGKIALLEKRYEEMRGEFARSKDFANAEKLKQLEVDNKSLQARLELANKKVNIINENVGSKGEEELEKRDKEIEVLKNNMQLAQTVIEKFKQDKIELEARLAKDGSQAKKLDEGFSSVAKNSKAEIPNQSEKDNALKALNDEKRALEEKYKQLSLEFKKIDQKLKFTTSQLESSGKKKDGGAGQLQKTVDAYSKQLEQTNARLSDATAELTEKKKELLKQKQDLNALNVKVAELEKKLAISEKKAA